MTQEPLTETHDSDFICNYCAAWAATTEKQFANRQRNMATNPEVKTFACPVCGSPDWATTRLMIVERKQIERRSWWRRMLERVKE